MLKLEKIDVKDAYAVILVLLVALGAWQFVPKTTLPEFESAVQIRAALEGVSVQPHVAIAAALEKAYASASGMEPQSAEAITSFLLFFSPVLLAVSATSIYIALRIAGMRKAESGFAALLFALSLSAIAFLPGVFSAASLACVSLCLFLPFAALAEKRILAAAPAIFFAFAAGYFGAAFAVAGAILALFFAYRSRGAKPLLAAYALCALAFAIGSAISGNFASLSFEADSLRFSFGEGLPFLLAASSACVALFVFGECKAEWLSLSVAGALLCALSPLAGAALLCLPAAHGISRAREETKKGAMLSAAFLVALVACFALAYPVFPVYSAIAASFLLALLAPLLLFMFGYPHKAFFAVLASLLLALCLFFAMLCQLPPQKAPYPSYLPEDAAFALSFLSEKSPGYAITLERQDAVRFYLPGTGLASKIEAEAFFLNGTGAEQAGYAVLSLSAIDALSAKGGFESYLFTANYTQGGRDFAAYVSQEGRLLAREKQGSGFALRDGALIDPYGAQYASVPLPRMLLLSDQKPLDGRHNRLLVLSDDALPPYLITLYSQNGSGAQLLQEFGSVAVFGVG